MGGGTDDDRRPAVRVAHWCDAVLALSAGCLVLAVHNASYLLRAPYWLDESWVVASTRMPLSRLRSMVGPSPALWTLVVRLQIFGGEQRQRVVPLVFAGLAVALGYAVLRVLGHGRVLALLLGAAPVLFAPAMLVRDDLKQYTADTFVLLLLLVLVARVDARWTRGRILAVGLAAGLGPGLSSAALFGGTAALAAVVVSALVDRRGRRLRDVTTAVVLGVIGDLFWLFTFLLPNTNQALIDYWRPDYPPRSFAGSIDYLSQRASVLTAGAGVSPLWVLGLLSLLGTAVLLARRRVATALVVPVAAMGVLLAGLLRLSPVLDARTSTWLFVGIDVIIAIGVAGVVRGLVRWRRVVGGVLALVILATAGGLFVHGAWPQVRSTATIPDENVRGPEQYVAAHRGPHDVVIVDFGASFAWAYYADLDVVPVRSSVSATGFGVGFPSSSRVVTVSQEGADAVDTALDHAAHLAGDRPGCRIWIVRSHMSAPEAAEWTAAMHTHSLRVVDGGWPVPILVESVAG